MISKLSDKNRIVLNFINYTMFTIDTTRPKTRQCMLEGFWFSDTFIWDPLYITYQEVTTF